MRPQTASDPHGFVSHLPSGLGAIGRGLFVAVVGASGAGKDTLIAHARQALEGEPGVRFARRVITRPPDAGGEPHEGVSPAAFAGMRQSGAFALSWDANGLSYGISRNVDEWIAEGDVVVANVSRAALADAARRYRRLLVVHVVADSVALRSRLKARGRESETEIEGRIAREVKLAVDPASVFVIDNSGAPDGPCALFVDLLLAAGASAAPD
ncbi:MAG: phosphonate metabolism protein/1,5-bisphosphokinase (PRPP-forming) PhnN [Flavobacteriaceae bacterium]